MHIKKIKTKPIIARTVSLTAVLDRYVQKISERSILVITSKVVALCEGRSIPTERIAKEKLIEQEAEYWLPAENKYGITLTIKGSRLIPTAGIDESNGNGEYVFWPKNPYVSARAAHQHLQKKFKTKEVGVIISDSTTAPLRLGTTGIAIASAGFKPLKNYIGEQDIFGRTLEVTNANIVDALAAAAVLVMGEGNEMTPIAIIEDVPFVNFTKRQINGRALKIKLSDDLYAPLLSAVKWRKGGQFGKVS